MSKLIFPDHGGVLVDDETKVFNTIRFKTPRGIYTIKIVGYPHYHKPYGYHYLTPDKEVVGSNSGNSYDADEALDKAKQSIRELEKQAILAKRTPSQKALDKLRAKIDFFLANAHPNDLKVAKKLALAEKFGEDAGWNVAWEYDQEPYELGDAEEQMPAEVFCAILRSADGNVLGSLSSIGDPSNEYKRVVEAELMHEAMLTFK